jgi:penicillin-binding protein 1B
VAQRKFGLKIRIAALWRRKWFRVTTAVVAVCAVIASGIAAYYYVQFARLIDARLHGERDRVLPRIYARPLELRRGESVTERQLVDRLNDLGYAQRTNPSAPGEFAIGQGAMVIVPRAPEFTGLIARVVFQLPARPARGAAPKAPAKPAKPSKPPDHIERIELAGRPTDRLVLDAPLLASVVAERQKRRPVALSAIPPVMWQAVLAIEDRRFYGHPGVDPIGIVGALLTNLFGDKPYLSGGSTITQQLARNFFLTDELAAERAAKRRSPLRKLREQFMSLVLETRASKDEILELYLNDVYLGQRGSFAIHGVAEAAKLFFGKDVSNVTVTEAATIAGVIQSPAVHSPFAHPKDSVERRNVVLHAMADSSYISEETATRAAAEPIGVVQRALEAEAPHFIDYVAQVLAEDYPGLTKTPSQAVAVYTTLDLHLQRLAEDAVRDGLVNVDQLLSKRKRKGLAEAALIAIDPRTGEILSWVGGRSYNQSQYNRVVSARRQPGSVFKPFVYLSAFERAAEEGRTDVTPATLVDDSPTTWVVNGQEWAPENYENEYDGLTTYRNALAHSRNIAAIKVAEGAGYDRVAALWKKLGVGGEPRAYPAIALGVFEATPLEIANAYTIFPNMGNVRTLSSVMSVRNGTNDITKKTKNTVKAVARPDTTFLVTNMMRSVINEGTGAGVRAAGFTLDAAGKTGTTNDLRDAWFVGFTPQLLTVVWVGFDDNQPLGLSGARAALPIWTQFMTRALGGTSSVAFDVPEGVGFAEIDPLNGKLAGPGCPKRVNEAFVAGAEPTEICDLHR